MSGLISRIKLRLKQIQALKFLILPVVYIYVIVLYVGCTENDGTVGQNINDPGFSGVVTDTVLYPAVIDTFIKQQINSGSSSTMFLGQNGGFKARFLLKFTYFANLPDSFLLDSAFIRLSTADYFGDTNQVYNNFSGSIHQLTEMLPENDWYESSVTWDSVLAFDPAFIDTFSVAQSADTDSVYFSLDPAIVEQWINADTTDPNMGLIVDYSGDAQFLKKFFSSENSDSTLKPLLKLYFTPYDSSTGDTAWIAQEADSLNIYASNDVYAAIDTVELDAARLYLGRSQAYRCLYQFDLTPYFPDFGVFINKLEFVLFTDTLHSLYLGDMTTVSPFRISSDEWLTDPDEAVYDYYSGSSNVITGDSIVVNISSYTSLSTSTNWLENPEQNYGFMLKFGVESGYIARLPIYPYETDDISKRPYLHVVYSTMEP